MGQIEREIVEEWFHICHDKTKKEEMENLILRVKKTVDFNMRNNSEIEACDLLMEIYQLTWIKEYLDLNNYKKVCNYLSSCVLFLEPSENFSILKLTMGFYLMFEDYPCAFRIAMRISDTASIKTIFDECKDPIVRKQLAFMAGRQQLQITINDEIEDKNELDDIINNILISSNFHNLARELDIVEPKMPDDVYKMWLENINMRPKYNLDAPVISGRDNLASTFVNAFLNAGFSHDKLVTTDGSKWIFKNKQAGMLSAAASLGLIHLWDVDGGLTPIDKYLYSSDKNIKAGALLALGIVNCGVHNECDPALALLSDYVLHSTVTLRIGAVFGLGLAYAGSCRKDVLDILYPVLTDNKTTPEIRGFAALSIGLICVGGSPNHEALAAILQILFDKNLSDFTEDPYTKYITLALGLCVMGQKDNTEALDEAVKVLSEPLLSFVQQMILMCAYAGSGDVLLIQKQLHICSMHFPDVKTNKKRNRDKVETEEKNNDDLGAGPLPLVQGIATLSVAVIAMGEEIATNMTNRIFGQLGRFGESAVRSAVPLALALSSISNPQMNVLDVLNKYSHDIDEDVQVNAILAMGLVGAGSNNGRLAVMLRQLAQYYTKIPFNLYMVRISQGLMHLGKGTLSLNPLHNDRQVMNPVALAGILITLVSFIDGSNVIASQSPYLLYSLVTAIYPRWLVTLDENLEPLHVTVRVGQAIDVLGKAGTPKNITGVRTHTTPVLLAVGEKAELATESYEPLSPVLEGFVILRKVD
uniref:26S proteasome non-ATPase regulatory subunit 2 n=2 Tax=Clastoptera arizonana TaxID=38151 RepID=A0A1B6D744_9HEMI